MKRRNLIFHLLSKHPTLRLLGLGAGLPGLLAAQAGPGPDGFVYETEPEFHTAADVDGDGRPDLVVADKTTGQFRVASGGSGGQILFREHPGDSGLGALTGFSVGHVLRDDRDSLVFADTSTNRIQGVDTPEDSPLTEPVRIPLGVPGPGVLTAIDLPGGADHNPDFLDLVYHSGFVTPEENSNAIQLMRNQGSGPPFDNLNQIEESGQPARPNRIFLDFTEPAFYAYRNDSDTGSAFVVRHTADPDFDAPFAPLSGLPKGAAYAYADFDGDDLAEFLFFQPGSDRLFEAEFDGSEIVPTGDSTYSYPIADIRVILSGGQPELLVLNDADGSYERIAYNGAGDFKPLQTFPAPSGEDRYTGAIGLGERLHLLVGDATGLTRSAVTHAYDGTGYKQESSQDATALKPAEQGASVILYDAPPLTDADARLLGRFDAGAWTSAFRLDTDRAVVESERYRGTADGLGDPETVGIATIPAATRDGLINQPFADISLRFSNAPAGEALPQLGLAPPSGHYEQAIRPELELAAAGDFPKGTIYYRTSQEPSWTTLGDAAPVLLQDTRFEAFASFGSGTYSNIVAADYTFPKDPSDMDADGDGIPDFVERAFGLDPEAVDDDADGDGVSDLQEILAGTDPTNANSFPDRSTLDDELPNSFDLLAAPAIPDPDNLSGSSLYPYPETTGADRPARLRVHQPNGFYLGQSPTETHAELSTPAARFEALERANRDLFAVVSTERNFPVDDGVSRDYGCQMAALLPYPESEFPPFQYENFGDAGGFDDLANEAKAWQQAARNYYDSLQRPLVALDPLDPESTLILLLVEKFLGERLHDRERIDRDNVSLTPFRESESPLDPGADGSEEPERDRALSSADLLSLQSEAAGSDPYLLRQIIETVESSIASPADADVAALVELTRTLYTTAAENDSPGSLRQPFDALRRFLRQGNLDQTGYDQSPAADNFPASLLSEAQKGAATVLAAIAPRKIGTVDLIRQGGESTECPVWSEVLFTSADSFDPDSPTLSGTNYALVDRRGEPFRFGRAFPLTEGSVFRVRGYLEDAPDCGGDFALEVIEAPVLVYLRNSSPADLDGDLIPDALAELNPGSDFAPFADSDDDGYTDLQEILDGTNPADPASAPSEVVDLSPPQLKINSIGPGSAAIEFEFPADYARQVEFVLYQTDDLSTPFAPSSETANHLGSGQHEQVVNQTGEDGFFIFRMQLK